MPPWRAGWPLHRRQSGGVGCHYGGKGRHLATIGLHRHGRAAGRLAGVDVRAYLAHARWHQRVVGGSVCCTHSVFGVVHNLAPSQAEPGCGKMLAPPSSRRVVHVTTPPRQPAVPIDQSLTPDGESVVCLECGRQAPILKRHLHFDHHLTEDEYRKRWGLAPDHPLVAPSVEAAQAMPGWMHGLREIIGKAKG
jgi:ROS/MUCR transcriptional regulator protein